MEITLATACCTLEHPLVSKTDLMFLQDTWQLLPADIQRGGTETSKLWRRLSHCTGAVKLWL